MKKIIVIGASSGMGLRIAQAFAAKGYTVGAAARREDRLNALKQQYPNQINTAVIDVTAPSAEADFLHLIERVGGMDILVYAAGCGWNNPDLNIDFDARTVRTNVDAFTTIISAAYRYYKNSDRPGHIAAITSVAGTKGIGISATYSASKRYQNTFLQAIDQLAHKQNVDLRITDIRPGFVDTDLLDTASRHYPLLMSADKVSARIVRVIERRHINPRRVNLCHIFTSRRRTVIINRRWALVVALWRLIPATLWRRLPL